MEAIEPLIQRGGAYAERLEEGFVHGGLVRSRLGRVFDLR
jgi:hypothetical protein